MKPKRQNIRKAMIILCLLLLPMTMFYFSPYTIILAAMQGIVGSSIVMFSLLFIISIFTGRLNCGYYCPLGGLQECLFPVNDKKAKGGKLNHIKYYTWFLWIAVIVILFILAGGIKGFNFFFGNENGFAYYPNNRNTYMIYFGVILGIALFVSIFGRRSYCHYLCWLAPFMVIGMKVGQRLKIPTLRLKTDKQKCIGCGKCSEECPMSLEVADMVQNDCMNTSECILCGECVDTCPKKVISYTFGRR